MLWLCVCVCSVHLFAVERVLSDLLLSLACPLPSRVCVLPPDDVNVERSCHSGRGKRAKLSEETYTAASPLVITSLLICSFLLTEGEQ